MKLLKIICCLLGCGTLFLSSALGLDIQEEDLLTSLDEYSLEDLLSIPVTSASGRTQNLFEVSNAMTVLTREDIERSGARTLEELFYRVPGMNIRRNDGHNFLISVRKHPSTRVITYDLLVLVDGVIVFNPLINGSIWNSIPVPIDEIERIEVIRGPGGVLYSANAVLGVINIITKFAKDSKNYASFEGGSQTYIGTSNAIGIKPLKNIDLYLRGFYHYDTDRGYRRRGLSMSRDDDIERHTFGFRTEYEFSEDTILTGLFKRNNTYVVNRGYPELSTPYEQHSSITNVASNFSHKHNEHYDFDFDFWHNFSENTAYETNDVRVHSTSIKTQHNLYFDLLGKNIFSTGVELLFHRTDVAPTMQTTPHDSQRIVSVFFQEEYRPFSDIIVTAGMRVDKNTNVKGHRASWQPRFSLMYLPAENHSVHLVASRMIRQTSFTEKDAHKVLMTHPFVPSIPLLTYSGSRDLDPEEFWTYEAGYRGLLCNGKLDIDALGFITSIRDAVIIHNTSATLPSTSLFMNNGMVWLYGFEVNIKYEFLNNLFLFADYSFVNVDADPEFRSTESKNIDDQTTENIFGFGLRYTWHGLKLDAYVKYMDDIKFNESLLAKSLGRGDQRTPSYFTPVFRIAYEFGVPKTNDMTGEIEIVARDFPLHSRKERATDDCVTPQLWGGIKLTY